MPCNLRTPYTPEANYVGELPSTRVPEADLIRSVREQFFSGSPMSIREAARRAGISDGTWRRIESGADVERKAHTVALMASVLWILPAQLDAAGRPDAAVLLERMGAQRAAEGGVAVQDGDTGYQALMAEILAGLAAIDHDPGLTGRMKHQLREELLTGLRQEVGEFQRHLRLFRGTGDASAASGQD